MNVGQIAHEWYAKNEPQGALAAAILRCFMGDGVIVKRPGFLLMATQRRTDGHFILPGMPHNCWFIEFVSFGADTSPYDLAKEAPYPLEYFAFKRKRKIKILAWHKLYNREIYYGRRTKRSSTTTTECRR